MLIVMIIIIVLSFTLKTHDQVKKHERCCYGGTPSAGKSS